MSRRIDPASGTFEFHFDDEDSGLFAEVDISYEIAIGIPQSNLDPPTLGTCVWSVVDVREIGVTVFGYPDDDFSIPLTDDHRQKIAHLIHVTDDGQIEELCVAHADRVRFPGVSN